MRSCSKTLVGKATKISFHSFEKYSAIEREDTAIFETPTSLNHFPTANDWCVLKCGLNDIFLSAHNEAMRWIFALHFPSSISSTGLLIFIDPNLPLKMMLP